MYTVTEIVEIDTAQNLILTQPEKVTGFDDINPGAPLQEDDFE